MDMKIAKELQIHLDMLDIDNEFVSVSPDKDPLFVILDPAKLLAHLCDDSFIARQPDESAGKFPVPLHRSDNPIGALQEWCMKRKTAPPVYQQTNNIGTLTAPLFSCTILCDGIKVDSQATNKAAAKREVALVMLARLAERHGKERP